MFLSEPSGPDLRGLIRDANAVGLPFVIIGSFSVIAHGFLRATKDSDLLVPAGPRAAESVDCLLERIDARRLRDGGALTPSERSADLVRVRSRRGIVEILRGGLAPLDFSAVAADAIQVEIGGETAAVASLRSTVGLKRFAGRPQDYVDLEVLKRVNGALPEAPILTDEGR